MVCTFFGHRDASDAIRKNLFKELVRLIEIEGVTTFYFGNQGNFDAIVASELKKIQKIYPHIECLHVLAYLPTKKEIGEHETILPEGIEVVPKRFAICYRNKWMIERADFVVGYTTRNFGGAAQFLDRAARMGKTVIRLDQEESSFS